MKSLITLLFLTILSGCNSKPEKSAAQLRYEADSAKLAAESDSINKSFDERIDSSKNAELEHYRNAAAIKDSL